MRLDEVKSMLSSMATEMDVRVDDIHDKAIDTQSKIFSMLIKEIEQFDTIDGKYIIGDSYNKRFALIQKNIQDIISKNYNPVLSQYLQYYDNIEAESLKQHQLYNGLDIDKSTVDPLKTSYYGQAKYYLTQGLADGYIQPAKFLIMQYVTKGSTVNDMRRALDRWNKGTLNAGELASDRHAPRLQAYSTQIARDTMYTYQGAIQDVIKQEYGLNKFIYVGGLVKDSRPFCRHLVSRRSKISFDEVPELVIQYPQGLKPDTTKKNFPLYRGGYNCNHAVMVVK